MVSSIGSSSTTFDATALQQMRTEAAAKMFKEVDTNQDGKITEEELSTAIEAKGGNQNGPSASEIMKQLDQGNKGYLTQQDVEDGMAKMGPPPGAPPFGKGGGGAAGASASSDTEYDPADLNQDGKVTIQERLQYARQQYEAQQEEQTDSSQGRQSAEVLG